MRNVRWAVPGVGVRLAVVGLFLALGAGCTTQTLSQGSQAPNLSADVAPAMVVENFMAAANDDDWDTMARLFGTRDGPYSRTGGSRQDVELRMNAIALILKHFDFEIIAQGRVPGRQNQTIRVGVDITNNEGLVPDVGFMVVQSNSGAWLVEEIELVKLTSA